MTQWPENQHRARLATADQLATVEQLFAFGVSAPQIARRTHTARKQVDAALAAAGSDSARAATVRCDFLTLDQSPGIAQGHYDRGARSSASAARPLVAKMDEAEREAARAERAR